MFYEFLTKFFILFFLLNALFWGLFPHEAHCQFVENFLSAKCPPHGVHIIISIIAFLIAVYLAQKQYINSLLFNLPSVSGKVH
jgi:hypothetical protein